MAQLSIKVDIHSDTVCPWCYLGKKSLDSAIATFRARHPGVDFDLVWRPYILHPTAKASAYPKGSSISAVLGPRAGPIFERIAATGAEYGINFRWEGLTGNSRDSHKLILLAAEQDAAAAAATSLLSTSQPPPPPPAQTGPASATSSSYAESTISSASAVSTSPQTEYNEDEDVDMDGHDADAHLPKNQPAATPTRPLTNKNSKLDAVIEAIFSGSFQEGFDASDRGFLSRVAVETGVLGPSEAAARAWFDGDAAGAAATAETTSAARIGATVDAETARAHDVGISAVPSYIVQGRYRIGGMQGPDVFLGLFEKILLGQQQQQQQQQQQNKHQQNQQQAQSRMLALKDLAGVSLGGRVVDEDEAVAVKQERKDEGNEEEWRRWQQQPQTGEKRSDRRLSIATIMRNSCGMEQD